MNRAQRRALARHPDRRICPHGEVKKTDGRGKPMCRWRCGFIPPIPQARKSARALVSEAKRSGVRYFDSGWNELRHYSFDEAVRFVADNPRRSGRRVS